MGGFLHFRKEVNLVPEHRSMKARGEDAAAAYLERLGVCVVERKWQCDAGTVDIIAFDGDVLVLVDVKTLRSTTKPAGQPLSVAKQRRVRKLAEAYLAQADLQDKAWRFDRVDILVIAEDRALLRHHRDAMSTGVE